MATVLEISNYLDGRVPFNSKLDFDNVGLLVGETDREVRKVLCALDITDAVIQEAAEWGAELILSHHPLIFFPIKSVRSDDLVGRKILALAGNGIAAICMHTNLDLAVGGVNDALIEALGVDEAKPMGDDGMARYGALSAPMVLADFLAKTKCALNANGLRYVDSGKPISIVGCCGGSGMDYLQDAIAAGCDAYVTGDVKYNGFLDAKELGVTLIDAGHFNTEDLVVPRLRDMLLEGFPELEIRLSKIHVQTEQYFA